jgi:ribokinase
VPAVLCIGDLDVDLLIGVDRLPVAGEKLNGRRMSLAPGGMMANSAAALAQLGGQVRLLATVGDDAEGDLAVGHLAARGVDTRFIVRLRGAPTFMCVSLVLPGGEKTLIRVISESYLPQPDDLSGDVFDGIGHVHLTLGSPSLTLAAAREAQRRRLTVSLDLEAADVPDDQDTLDAVLAETDILIMSREAASVAEARLGRPAHGRDITVTTLGPEGAEAERGASRAVAPGYVVDAVDTTGAGDAFAAGFLHAHLRGSAPEATLRFANAVAALATRGAGAQASLPTREEVDAFMLQETRK